jgi:hypothetical protein
MTGSALNHKSFFNGIRKLVGRWTKYIEKQGDYIEK